MKYYVTYILKSGAIGSCIGVMLNSLFYFIAAFFKETLILSSDVVILNFIVCILVGFYCAAISVVYEIEHWSLLRATITHAILMAVYLPVAYFMGWMPTHLAGTIGFMIQYLVVYVIIWFSFKTYYAKKAKEMTNQLKQL